MARKKQEIILENVVIESVAAEGKAIARIDGTVLFVQFAVPSYLSNIYGDWRKLPSDEQIRRSMHSPVYIKEIFGE